MGFDDNKNENAKIATLEFSDAMRRPKTQSRKIKFSFEGTLNAEPEGSEAVNAAPIPSHTSAETFKSKYLYRLRGGGDTDTNTADCNEDASSSKEDVNTDTNTVPKTNSNTNSPKKLTKNQKRKQRKKKANKLLTEQKLNTFRKELKEKFESEKKIGLQRDINYFQLQLEVSDCNLSKIQEKLHNVPSSSTKFNNHLMNSICKIYDEKEYYEKKLKKCKVIMLLLQSGNRAKRLPRNLVKRKKLSTGERTTRSTNKDDNCDNQQFDLNDNDDDISNDSHSVIEISSSEESDEDDMDDEDFVYEEHIEEIAVASTIQRKKVGTTKRNKSYKSKNQEFLIKKYKLDQMDIDSEEEEMFISKKLISDNETNLNHQWVYDLRKLDNQEELFSNKYLVILRGNSSRISKLRFQDLQQSEKNTFKSNISGVQFIQRGSYTQLYIIKELQRSLHFTLGSTSTKTFINYCKKNQVKYNNFTNGYQVDNNEMTLKNQLNAHLTDNSIEYQYTEKMIELSKSILPVLLSSKNPKTCRAEYVMNLGITDQKVHLHKRKSLTGKSGLQLISTWTKSTKITNESKTQIGQFLLFLIKNVIPTTSSPHIFEPSHPCEKEYLELFARQLNLYEEHDLQNFNIPAVSLLINNTLNPHCDTKNPISPDHDATFSITVQVPIKSLSMLLQQVIPNQYTNTIPFCIVMYKRQCLMHLSQYERKIDSYISSDEQYTEARKKIIQILSHSVYSDLDYGGLFFTKHRKRLIDHRFEIQDNRIFTEKMAFINEAVDKCGYWSSLLHVYYLYAHFHGVKRDDVLSFVLFFAHQCNTTVIIVKAMITLIEKKTTMSQMNYYILP